MLKASCKLDCRAVEAMEAALYELAPSNWYVIENRLNGNGFLEGVFENQEEMQLAVKELESVSPIRLDLSQGLRTECLEDRDWKEAYKHHFQAWTVGNFHCIPIWEKESYEIPENEIGFYLDPGMAFGTGNHETTKLCLESLVDLSSEGGKVDPTGKSLIDLGCGSGIIAITAKLLGYDRVDGIDLDPDAARISSENAALNAIDDIHFRACGIDQFEKTDCYDVVVANIQTDVLQNLSEEILTLANKRGMVILSGILKKEVKELERHFLELLSVRKMDAQVEIKNLNEWSLLGIKLR